MILEAVYLLVGLAAALAEQDFRVFEGRRVDRHEAERLEGFLEFLHEGRTGAFRVRKIVTESFQDSRFNDVGHFSSAEIRV